MKEAISYKINSSIKTKKPIINDIIKHKWLYIMLSLGLIYLFIFRYIPMYGVLIAFKDFDMVKGILNSDWVGFRNFERLLASKDFYVIFKNSLLISLYRLVWGFPVPVILAIMLNEVNNLRYKKIVQTVIYLPHFISWVVIAGIINNFLSPSNGIINYIITSVGGESIAFLQKPQWFRTILVLSEIWKESGWGTIVYLAAISAIDTSLYESAKIDGANRFVQMWRITIPGIMPTIVVLLILKLGQLLNNGFEQIFLLYSPLVYDVADVFETYSYRIGLMEGVFSYATAIGLFQSVVGLILLYFSNKFSKRISENSIW